MKRTSMHYFVKRVLNCLPPALKALPGPRFLRRRERAVRAELEEKGDADTAETVHEARAAPSPGRKKEL